MIFKKEFLRDIYPHATKFECLKFTVRSFLRKAVNRITWTALIASVAYGLFTAGTFSTFTVTNAITGTVGVVEPIVVDSMPKKIEEIKDEVVNTLLKCESAGHSEEDGILIYDDNSSGTLSRVNKPSIGQLQFKVTTVQNYEKIRSGKVLTNKEAVILALDTEQAKELAKWIIFEQKGGIFNWLNCAEKHNLAEEVTVIKKLLK